MKEYLPVGSVVTLKNMGEHSFMLIGYFPKSAKSEKRYDYMAVLYPLGIVGKDSMIAFNRSQIEKVLFEGYRDEESNALTTALTDMDERLPELVKKAAEQSRC